MDRNGDGVISLSEFLSSVVGQMPSLREAKVVEAFRAMMTDYKPRSDPAEMFISWEKLVSTYDPANHPEVLRGRMAASALEKDLLASFPRQEQEDQGGKINLLQFCEYHANLSCAIFDEDAWATFVRTAWGLGLKTESFQPQGVRDHPNNPYQKKVGNLK
jgi:hypothetical protein